MSTPEELHQQLLQVATESTYGALYERCDDGVQQPDMALVPGDAELLEGLTYPAVCVTAERSDGVPGGVCLCTSAAGARALAIRSLDPLPPEAGEEPLGDGDLEAAREWGGEVTGAVGAAAAAILGSPLALDAPAARAISGPGDGPGRDPDAPLALRVSLAVHGEPCVLLLFFPAGDDGAGAPAPGGVSGAAPAPAGGDASPPAATAPPAHARDALEDEDSVLGALPPVDLSGALTTTRVPVWAELGRVRLPLRRATDIPVGEVVELDCEADAPVELYVNGLRFAQGELIVTADGDWALRIAQVDPAPAASQ